MNLDRSKKQENKAVTNPVLFVAFFSGLTVLAYELLWTRYLNLIFGVSTYAVATVLTCFMIGLAAGSYCFGRWADRCCDSSRLLLKLQGAIAIIGFLSPFIFSLVLEANTSLFQAISVQGFPKHLLRFFICTMVLIPPTMLMGGTFPIYLKWYNRSMDRIGRDVSRVYAINTLGGALGAYLSGFFLLRYLGVSASIYLASGINLILFVVLFRYIKRAGNDTKPRPQVETPVAPEPYGKKVVTVSLIAVCLSGFTGLSYQVYWTKILTLFFRDTIYDFSIILSTFLIGIVGGSLLCGKFLLPKIRKHPHLLATIQVLIGVSSLVSLFFISRLPEVAGFLQSMPKIQDRFGEGYWIVGALVRFGYSALLMLVPTLLFGAAFPLASKICIPDSAHRAGKIGKLAGLNTLAAAFGAFLGGFIFIDRFGLQNSIAVTALLNMLAGMALFAACSFRNIKFKTAMMASSIGAMAVLLVLVPEWDRLKMSTYILETGQPIHELLELQYYNEDAYGITAVADLPATEKRYLVTNRLYMQSASDLYGYEDHRRMGYLPMLLADQPDNVLVIGLGAGITLRGVAEMKPSHIDCVEISKSVVEANALFTDVNADILNNPRISFTIDDGRHYILTTPKKYDVIIADIFFPMAAGSSAVLSKEYFAAAKERLTDDGLFAAWLPIHQLSLEEIKMVLNTFRSVYPHTSVWFGMVGENVPSIACIGTQQPLQVSMDELFMKMTDPQTEQLLRQVHLENPIALLGNFIMDGSTLRKFCAGAKLNTDDRPRIEFTNPLNTTPYHERAIQNVDTLLEYKENIFDKPFLQ